MLPGQPAVLSKATCPYAGVDWLDSSVSQRMARGPGWCTSLVNSRNLGENIQVLWSSTVLSMSTKRVCIVSVIPGARGSPSHGGIVAVYVVDINQLSLPTLFIFCFCVYFCLYGPFICILFHKLSQHLSAFLLCSFVLISALLVLSTI